MLPALGLQMLKIREPGDFSGKAIAKSILQPTRPSSNHRIPLADLLGQSLEVTPVSKAAFIFHILQDAQVSRVVQEFHNAQMATQKVFDAATFWI